MENTQLSDTYHPARGIRMATPQNSYKRRGMRINRMIQTTMNDLQTTRLQSRYRLRDRGTPLIQREADLQSNFQTCDINAASQDSAIDQNQYIETIKKSATMSTQQKSRSITPSYAYGYGEISLHKDSSLGRSTFKNLRFNKMSMDRERYN